MRDVLDRTICPGCGNGTANRIARCRRCGYAWPESAAPRTIRELLEAGQGPALTTGADLAAFARAVADAVWRFNGQSPREGWWR